MPDVWFTYVTTTAATVTYPLTMCTGSASTSNVYILGVPQYDVGAVGDGLIFSDAGAVGGFGPAAWLDPPVAGGPGAVSPPAGLHGDYMREHMRREAERIEAARAAQDRANQLLVSLLDHEQRASWAQYRHFDVVVGTRRYRLRHGWVGNVAVLDSAGLAEETLCIHPMIPCPIEDNLIAQKLLLEADEATFLRTANHTLHRRPLHGLGEGLRNAA